MDVSSAALPSSPIPLIVPVAASAGAYTGVITVNNAGCTGPGSTFNITINPNPDPITGETNICTGSTSLLSDSTAGGTWSSVTTSVATIDSTGLVSGLTIGTSLISYTLTSTGCSSSTLVNVVGISGPDEVCNGDTITLSATSSSGIWTSSDSAIAAVNDSTGVVTGASMGTAHISYTLGSGCVASWTVTVNPHAPIVGRDSVCLGSDRWLTNIVGGGTWTSSLPSIATVLPDSGKVSGITAGITNITYTLPTGCISWVPFTVINYPGAITGTKKACPGTTTTLHNTVTGGTWTSRNPGIAMVNPATGVVTGVYADTVNIVYTIEPGCPVQTRVTINPLPEEITGNDVLCPNTEDSLHDATPYGLWSSGTPPVVTVVDTTGVITAVSHGTGIITYTLPTGCYRTKTVSVEPLPIPGIIYNPSTGTLLASAGYITYQWYDSIQGKIPGATSPSIAALNTEYYYVKVTDSNGCTGISPLFHFDVRWLGVSNVTPGEVRVYPNPAHSALYISSPVKVRVVISSMDGKEEINEADARKVDISRLADGMYMITLYDEHGLRLGVRKFTKE